jgi:hypothetical protein
MGAFGSGSDFNENPIAEPTPPTARRRRAKGQPTDSGANSPI